MIPQPTDEDLATIAEQVWSSYLDPDGESPLIPFPAENQTVEVAASVSVTGAWKGHVVICCSMVAAKDTAAALLGVELDEVTAEDITDALGEIANIIGGNIKSLLPEPCALSLPHVVLGRIDRNHWGRNVERLCHLDGTWKAQMVTISVFEGDNSVELVPTP